MIQIRLVDDGAGGFQLQQREREPLVDAAGAFCGFGVWSEWQAVAILYDPKAVVPVDKATPDGTE